MVRLLRALPVPLALITMTGIAGAVLGRVYAGPLLTQLVLGAAIGSVGVSVATRRLPSWLVAPVSVAALAGYTVFALRLAAERAGLDGSLGALLAEAGRNGIPRLLTAMIPVEPVPDTLVVPVVAAWLAGLAGAEVALRAGRVLLGLAAPVCFYVGARYLVGPNADPAIWPTVAFAAAAAVALAARSRPSAAEMVPAEPGTGLAPSVRAALRVRAAASTAAGMAAVLGLAALLAPLVADRVARTPVDPRRYVQPPQVESLDENPLIRISGWALNPEQKLLDVRSSNEEELRIRLAVLHDYDGVTWRVGATYRNAGRVLPATEPLPGATVDTVQQEITVGELTGRLLPAAPTPQQITGARVAYDPTSGTLIRPEGLVPGLRYTVTSLRERPDPDLLVMANVPAGDPVARVLEVEPGVPEAIQRLADQLATDNGAPYARAIAIEEFLAAHYRMVADAPSGHAYPNLNFFLFGPRNAGGQRGTSEQFAAAFAVLGRLMGLPTRVVVGFSTATGNGPVHGADAYAWPEVLFDGIGWVAFDPLPRPDTQPRPVEEGFKPKPENPPPTPDEVTPAPEPTPTGSAPVTAADPGRPRGATAAALAGSGAGIVLLVAIGFLLVITSMRRTQRRRRLYAGSPAQRIAGAWREMTDTLRLAGQPVADHLAATEVATHAREVAGNDDSRPPVPPIDELATLVNLATFAPGTASDEQARQAAELAVAYAAALRAGHPWWRQALWSVHPGPLRWRR